MQEKEAVCHGSVVLNIYLTAEIMYFGAQL